LDPPPFLVTSVQKPIFILVITDLGKKIKHKQGRLYANTFKKDRKYLFLYNLYEKKDNINNKIISFLFLSPGL
jgi:hypothetical protein